MVKDNKKEEKEDVEGLAARAMAAVHDLAASAGADISTTVGTGEEDGLDEMSAMAGGAVGGYASKKDIKKKKLVRRESSSEEMELREIIRQAIKQVQSKQKFIEHQEKELRFIVRKLIKEVKEEKVCESVEKEQKLRSIIKTLILEIQKDIEDVPHKSTAINLLEELLKRILPTLETSYKSLTTKIEQRSSFRAHIINASSTALETEDINSSGSGEMLDLDEQEIDIEEVDIKVGGAESDEDKFIDIDTDSVPEPEPEDAFGIEGQDETGRKVAKPAFDQIEKNIVETYGVLSDVEDKKLFKDYLITNLKLYFDKWENELGSVKEPTTDEYEAEKAGIETGGEDGKELGGREFGTKTTGEKFIQ